MQKYSTTKHNNAVKNLKKIWPNISAVLFVSACQWAANVREKLAEDDCTNEDEATTPLCGE